MPASRLLVIGANSMREAAFGVWAGMGLDVVLADGWSSTRYEHLAREFVPLDVRDGAADLDALTRIARGCDGVTTLADNSQLTAASVAERAGLPGVDPAAAAVARSKLRQREVCGRNGMVVPRWRHVPDAADIADFFAGGPRPAVLKPVDSAGGAGVLRVSDAADAVRLWPIARQLSPSRTVIVEDRLIGREFCVDAVLRAGEPVFVSMCEADVVGPAGFIAVSARYAAEPPQRAAATVAIRRLAGVLGLRDANVHAEFKVDGDRWTLLETALRPGGALVPEVTERVTGVSLYREQARIALGEPPRGTAERAPEAAFGQVRFLVAEGRVRRFVPPGTVLAGLPDVKVTGQFAGPGQRLRIPVSEEGRAGYATGWCDDPDRLDAQLRVALQRLCEGMGLRPATPAGVAVADAA
jgi:biotin carboxylase